MPLGRPAIVTMTVLVFMWTWNEFLIPLVMVTSESLRTAPLGLAFFQGQYTQGFTLLAAGAVLVARRWSWCTCSCSGTSSRGCSRAPSASSRHRGIPALGMPKGWPPVRGPALRALGVRLRRS